MSPAVTASGIPTVEAVMARQRIGSALVAREGRLLGIFTVTDACRILAETLRAAAPHGPG